MKKSIIFLIISLFFKLSGIAGEGMWIPMLLEQLNEKEMKAMGMNITAEDIYSINHSSLKDAIVLFGRGCTAEIISDKGLLLTNHHCGFGAIQRHSSIENDYLTDGFWAMNQDEELPNPGLTVTLMVRMEEVTNQVLEGVEPNMSEADRDEKIKENSDKIIEAFEKDSEYQAAIKPFFKGNAFYMIITETFKDVRLVGAPPSNIGKFGGDTDNWMWPRHTGDFSIFRIYTDKDGKPAEYSEDNIPYKPKYHFPISLKGVDEGDFTFVFGYPARTNEYLPSYAVEMITESGNPHKIKLRETRLDIFNKYASADPKVRIQYASKDARVANYWKKMIGESSGIERLDGIEKKQAYEAEFNEWANSSEELKKQYGNLIPAFETAYEQLEPISLATDYIAEAGLAMEIVSFARNFSGLVEMSKADEIDEEAIQQEIESLKRRTSGFFKDYYQPIDEEVMTAMLKLYDENLTPPFKPDFFNTIHSKYKNNYQDYTNYVFSKSIFDNEDALNELLDNYKPKKYKKLVKDPAYLMASEMMDFYDADIKTKRNLLNHELDSLQRIYMKAQMEMEPEKRFYPDANFTLRVTYGYVDGYHPKDAVYYKHFTTLEGIMEKEDPDIYDYVVEDRLKELYQNKDYGQYADEDGNMHVAFVASNHTTGGNSGSPVLNADGELVGVNFDRCWEGTMSDLMYDPEVCRNISIDIRYFLFIVDKFAGAGYLVEEMDLVK
ncbi:MAG: serine protease [Marinilabiliales bacterium]|nr:MAG: serine protease [Marinilabiliales bacterium]